MANQLADMIVQFEKMKDDLEDDEPVVLFDPEDEVYHEDDVEYEDSNDDDVDDDFVNLEDLSDADSELFSTFKLAYKSIAKFSSVNLNDHCKCN